MVHLREWSLTETPDLLLIMSLKMELMSKSRRRSSLIKLSMMSSTANQFRMIRLEFQDSFKTSLLRLTALNKLMRLNLSQNPSSVDLSMIRL